jgi:hypothetical protein
MALEQTCGGWRELFELICATIGLDSNKRFGIDVNVKNIAADQNDCAAKASLEERIRGAVSVCPVTGVISLNIVQGYYDSNYPCGLGYEPPELKLKKCFVYTDDGEWALNLFYACSDLPN